jgi:leucyl aminopeptidase (aminopeptidase T)
VYELELIRAAERIVKDVMNVQHDHKVLVVTDAAKESVGNAIALACRGIGAETVVALMPLTGEHGNEPPATIAAAMASADVVFAPTTHAITHTRARLDAFAAGAKVVILRGVDEDMMMRGAMSIDFNDVKDITARVAQTLAGTGDVKVTSPAGTDVSFSVKGRKIFRLDGFFQEEMGFAALPGGECPTSPVEGTTEGTIVVDYSMDSIGRLTAPLILMVKRGRVTSVQGSPQEAGALEKLFETDDNARNIAEFAIGTNRGARLIGNLAEDKKLLGTVHFAIGDNKSLGGNVEATIHLDGLLLSPTVIADTRVVVQDGKLLV